MGGAPNGNMMTPAEAKRRLLELDRRESSPAALLGNPIVLAAALLALGVSLRATRGRHRNDGAGAAFRKIAARAALAAAPALVEQFIRGISKPGPIRAGHPDAL